MKACEKKMMTNEKFRFERINLIKFVKS